MEAEVFIPKTKKITLSAGEFTLAPLNMRQVGAIGKALRGMTFQSEGAGVFIDMLGQLGEKLPEVLGNVLSAEKPPDEELLKKCALMQMPELAKLCDVFTEVNDLNDLKRVFSSALARWFPVKKETPEPDKSAADLK